MNTILDKFQEIYLPRSYKKSKKPFQKSSHHHVSWDSGNTDEIMKLKVKNYVKNPMSDYLQQNEPNYSSKNEREKGIFTNMRFMRL